MDTRVETIAAQIRQAESTGQPIAPITEQLFERPDDASLDVAYQVQQLNTEFHKSAGRVVSGRKIGLTSSAVQKQLGVDQPDFGMLWTDTEYQQGEEIPFSRVLQPKIECEIALILKSPLDMPQPGLGDVIQAVDFVLPALEIAGSRIADWKISIYDTIADNASSGVYVLGGPPRKLDGLDLQTCGMVIERDGQPVSTGCGAACLGHPLHAAVWLAKQMAERNDPMQAGEVILTGALGPMVNVNPGDVFRASINGLGTVTATFSK